jgi:hypothetical protein
MLLLFTRRGRFFSEARAAEIGSQGPRPRAEPQNAPRFLHVPLFVIGLSWAVIRSGWKWGVINEEGKERFVRLCMCVVDVSRGEYQQFSWGVEYVEPPCYA